MDSDAPLTGTAAGARSTDVALPAGAARARLPETALYLPVKRFLEAQGYVVRGEVNGCDLVAVRGDEPPLLVIAELKLGFTLELVLQGVDRLRAADAVWLAVAASRNGRDRDRRVARLCRLLGFGLLAVRPMSGQVEILAEPLPYRPRADLPRRRRLLREHAGRAGDHTPGGGRGQVMTVYRQQALACAAALRAGRERPRDLAAIVPDAGSILLRNVYGWFERVERGHYRLTEAGKAALLQWGGPAA
jgi:hypothetical protein